MKLKPTPIQIRPIELGGVPSWACNVSNGYLYKVAGMFKPKERLPKLNEDCFVMGCKGESEFRIIFIGERSLLKLPGQKLMIEIVKQSDAYKEAMSKGSISEYRSNNF